MTLVETPVKGPGARLHNPISEAVLRRRNVECLLRLAAMAERPTEPRRGGGADRAPGAGARRAPST